MLLKNSVITALDNDLLPVQCPANSWNDTYLLSIDAQMNTFEWNLNQNLHIFSKEDAFEAVTCKI